MTWTDWIPATKAISIGEEIFYRLHKHWGMNIWAGEGLHNRNGDASGCLHSDNTCPRPLVVFQRIYEKNGRKVSAVLSYPNGLSSMDCYFWEIYPGEDGDVERFTDEDEMENAIRKLLNKEAAQ